MLWYVLVVPILGALLCFVLVYRLKLSSIRDALGGDQPGTTSTVISHQVGVDPEIEQIRHAISTLSIDIASLRRQIGSVAEQQLEQAWELSQSKGLTLELRAVATEVDERINREIGDARRAFNAIDNRLERLGATESALSFLDAEFERFGLQLDVAIASLSTRLEAIEGLTRAALARDAALPS